jgi:hypothetical protein
MALAYAQSITAAAMKLNFESVNNINDKEIFYSIFDTLNTEYAKMASDALASYTVTSGLQASLEAKLLRMGDSVQVEILKSFFVVLLAEYLSVETLGLSYVITTSATKALIEFEDLLHQAIANICNVERKIALHLLIAQIQAEHVILAAAN